MCIFIDQHGNIVFKYRAYEVHEVMPFRPQMRIRPNNLVNLVARGEKHFEQHVGNLGLRTGRFDWNARDDRLATSPLWNGMWKRPGNHVVIPISHGYEATTRHGKRRWFAIKRNDGDPMLIPGLGRVKKGPFRTEWHVTMVTVDAGPVFEPIHDTPREIVTLRDWDEAKTWLAAEDEKAMRRLLRPAGIDLLRSYRVHDDVFKDSFPAERCSEPLVERTARGIEDFGGPPGKKEK
ncbi:MAG: SOS response-associated peptidase family protein [Euryarchaeota archaeon]|nr:SOS response-associated peptidase family protein [Euryarchaeota archaeon]